MLTRTFKPCGDDAWIEPAAIRPSGKEAEEVRDVLASAVQRDELVDRQLRHRRDVREIGTVIAHRDLDETRRRTGRRL